MPSTIKQCNTMQNQAIMSCKNHAKIVQNELLVSSVKRHTDYTNSIQRKPVRNKLPGLYGQVYPRMRGPPKKTGPVKKEWQVGQDNDSRSRRPRTAAPGLARGRMVPSCCGAAERQKTLAAQDGKCALCGCGLTAGTCELDHVVPVRQAFAGTCRLCRRCAATATARRR